MPETRQLAAIMFSDIEGYTRMMEHDEQLGRLSAKRYRQVLEEGLSRFEGSLINSYGDGSLCIFPSAVLSVRCAYAIQLALQQDPKVPLRIGLHLGDIVVDGEEVFGAGVNTAARIESMGVAGSVLLSDSIARQLHNHSEFELASLGAFEFKNVKDPLEVFALKQKGLIVPEAATLQGKFKENIRKNRSIFYLLGALLLLSMGWWFGQQKLNRPAVIQSMAILPFQTSTAFADEEVLSDGVHEGLVSALGQLQTVHVINKRSIIGFSTEEKSFQEIGRELNVDGIMTGDLSVSQDSLHLDLRLVKTGPNEKELWSNVYGRKVDEVLQLFQDVRTEIAQTIRVGITTADGGQQASADRVDPETYKAFLRGRYFLNKSTPEDFQKGMKFLMDAVDLDPADPRAYGTLAWGYGLMGHGPDPSEQVWKRGRAAAEKSLSLDSMNVEALLVKTLIKFYYEWDWDGAENGFKKVLSINPNEAFAHFQYAWFLACFGRWDEAVYHHQLAKELDPLTPIMTSDLGNLYLWAGDTINAIKEAKEGLELDPEFLHGWFVLGNVYNAMGDHRKAIEAHQKAAAGLPIWKGVLGGTYAMAGQPEKAREILNEFKSGVISPRTAFWIAYIHCTLGEKDEAFEWLDYNYHDPWLVSVRTWPEFRLLHDDPRFKTFLDRLGQPPIDDDVN